MELQDKVFTVLVVAFVSTQTVATTTDLGGWLVFISLLIMWVGAFLIALMAIPMVPDFLPDDIVNLIVWLGVTLEILWIVLDLIFVKFSITGIL